MIRERERDSEKGEKMLIKERKGERKRKIRI